MRAATQSRLRGTARRRLASLSATVAILASATAPALAINDLGGNSIPNTNTSSATAQLGATSVLAMLGTPFSAPQGAIGSPNSPEEDLSRALADLATAPDQITAEAARVRALAILEGNPVAGAAYSGIGLLNHATAAKVQTVPGGGTVVVKLVRFGEHEISDTWMLDFQNPDLPFSIEYHVTELDTAAGGDFTPTPLLKDGATPIGGMHSVVRSIGFDETNLGTTQISRFTTARGLGPQNEHTRLGTRKLTVNMPPPKFVSAILDPNLRPNHEALSTLRPFGPVGNITIGDLAPTAPEVQLHAHLSALNTADVAAANTLGAQDAGLVAAMRVKSHLPAGVSPVPGAAVTVVFMNNEVYVSRKSVRLGAAQPITVGVVNADGFTHAFSTNALHNHKTALDGVLGATTWGEFDWEQLGSVVVAGGSSQSVTVTPASDAFELLVGDPGSGDQAQATITLDRGPVQESFRVPGPAFASPLHDALDAQGNVWITLAGSDKIGKLTPANTLSQSTYVEYNLPVPANFPAGAAEAFFGPLDIQVDGHGIVWATLGVGNAIMRLDPAQASPGTSNGIEIHTLAPCAPTECRLPPPPAPPGVFSRNPTQMTLRESAAGTEVWFTELFADKIGVVRRNANGSYSENHFTCACKVPQLGQAEPIAGTPSGIDHDAIGLIWFTAANKNSIGRLIPPADPFATTVASIQHYLIPSSVVVQEPDIGGTFATSVPHSVEVSPDGKVWFTELATAKVGWLDPAQVVAETTQGMHEINLGTNDFGADNQPADLVADPAGTIFTTDEYGDQITEVTPSGVKDHWRPTERVSLTDQPMVDGQGNLWFLEAGANLITRIKGIAATSGPAGGGSSSGGSTSGGTTTGGTTGTGVDQAKILAARRAAEIRAEKIACGRRRWSYGPASDPRVLLLKKTARQVQACLGRPTKKTSRLWTYGTRIQVRFTRGRVTSFVVLNRVIRSQSGNIGIGSSTRVLKRLSRARVIRTSSRAYRTILRIPAGGRADIRYAVKRGKVTRITVILRAK